MTASALPFVSVVIPSYNRRASLVDVVAALARQSYPPDRFEALVVLDGSDDGSGEALERSPLGERLTVLWQPKRGAAAARNRGAARARGDLLVLLDDDVIPQPDLILAHARAHRERPGEVGLGRLLFSTTGRPSVITRQDVSWYERHFAELARPDHVFGYADFFAGNVSLARRDFLDVGGFDEAFTTYGCEDWDLGLRLLQAGRRFHFVGDAVGVHRSRLDFQDWQHHAYWDGRSESRFARKHPEIKHTLQLPAFYQGSRKRRLGTRLLRLAPGDWPSLASTLARMYLNAEQSGQRRSAETLARLNWIWWYWRGLGDELGGTAAMDHFLGFRVPMLAYHRVTDRPHPVLAEFAVSPATFRRQMEWLRARGYRPISLSRFYHAYRDAAPLPPRPVVITFDDGYEETATIAAPILREFRFPATLFVVAERVGGHNEWDAGYGPPAAALLSWEQIAELAGEGMEIGGHTATHPTLPQLSDSDLARELGASRTAIEDRLSRPVRWLAYPFGKHDQRVREAARAAGYLGALEFGGGLAAACDDLFALRRIPVGQWDGVAGFAAKLVLGEDWWTATKRHTPLPLKTAVRMAVGRRRDGSVRMGQSPTSGI